MKQNGTAKVLQIIGWIEFASAFILSIFLDVGIEGIDTAIIISGTITAILIEGFAEVIELLHQSRATQNEILKQLQRSNTTQEAILAQLKDKPASKTVLEDIESNLPQI